MLNRRCIISLIMQTPVLTGNGAPRSGAAALAAHMRTERSPGLLHANVAEALGSASRSCAVMGRGMPDLGVPGLILAIATAFLILTSLTLSFC